MKIPSVLFGRTADVEYVHQCAVEGACCSLVGVSNLGKSALLRSLCELSNQGPTRPSFIYIDCNQMPERTPRAFFTATWQAISARLLQTGARAEAERLEGEILPASDVLSFSLHLQQAFELTFEHLPQPLVLCFDEFDEAYTSLEPQTFLNLRALRDRYCERLVYVTATERELARLTNTREQGEFYELVAPRVHFLHFMEPEETKQFCESFAAREHVTFSESDLAFIHENADGHPGLVQAVCYALGTVTGAAVRNEQQDRVIHEHVQQSLAADGNVQSECAKIWTDLEPDEREALLRLRRANSVATPEDQAARSVLLNKYIIRDGDAGPHVFCNLFDDFVRRQKLIQQPDERGVYIDVDAGDVWVEGKPVEALTDLEYRLLLFLYGRIDRVCDKYSIVEAVWGQDYIDKVDDTRIEKLVSRLRQKIEPDAAHPHYLQSLRGRGYKLVR